MATSINNTATNMARQDSGNPAESKALETVASAAQTPAAKQKQSKMSPFGAIFTPSKVFSTNSSPPSGTLVNPVYSAMSLLNIDSTPEAFPSKPSSGSVKPIGSESSSPGRMAALKDGPGFTTDVDANFAETRYARFGMIPDYWFQNGLIEAAFDSTGLVGLVDMAFSGPGDYPGFVSLYCRFDDLRAAAASKAMFEMALSTATFRFVDGHQFFAMDHANPARVVSAFEGQLELTAIPRNTMQFDVFSIYEEVFELVKQYGSVRSFAYIQPTAFEAPRFRVEFHSQKAAESVVGPSGIKDDIYVSDFISVSAKNFEPAGYTHPAFANGHPQFGPDGFSSPARGGLSRAHGGFRGNGGRGGAHNDHWWMPAVDSRIHNTNLEYWKFNQPQTVNLAKIEAGIDVRTTIMLRNIPNRTQFEDLKDFLDETSFGHYDFSYLRIDFSNNQNVGYAFVNFVRPEYIVEFVAHRVGKPWGLFQSQKRCEVSYATIQGIDCLLAKFRNSVVMEEYSAFRPKLWYHVDSTDIPAGKVVGDEAEFPASDNEQKRKRSRDNAGTVGLFPPRHGKGAYGPDAHYREGRYDRGTSFAIAEEREHEQQRLQRNNDRRQIGHRGGNNRGQFYSHRGHGRQQPARISHESYHNNHDEFDGYSDEQDGFYHVSRRSPYQRR